MRRPAGRPASLRWRIAALVAATTCTVAAGIGLLVHEASLDRTLRQSRDVAIRQLDLATATYVRTGSVRGSGATLEDGLIPEELRRLVAGGHVGAQPGEGRYGEHVMWAARPVGGRTLAVEIDLRGEMRDLKWLDTSTALAGLGAVAVVVPLGVVVAGRLSRRLRYAADTARRIADGDLEARIAAGGRPGDEIAEISAAVDSMAGALHGRLLAEQRFTADVAHELRTPLMGLVTATELLPDSEAAGYVRDRVAVLSTLVEELLEVSRLDAGAERPDPLPCPLGESVAEAVHRTGLDVRVRVVSDAVVVTDARRLDRILGNLVANAHRHGREPVEVTVDGPTVTVRDHGAGYPPEVLAGGPRRFRTGARERGRGHGLGLTIALGQAGVLGAELALGNAPEGGALARLRLPAGIDRGPGASKPV